MKLGGIALLLCAAAIPAGAQQAQKLTLADALQLADRQNLDLVAARAQRAVALAGVQIAGERPNPTANFTALRDEPHEGVFFDLPLEIGSKRKRRIALARQNGTLTEDDITSLERLVRQNVRDAYFGLALARNVTGQKADALKLAQRLEQIAQARYESGDVPQLEVSQAELGVSQAQADFQVAAQEEKIALSQLNAFLNEPPVTPWELATSLESLPPPFSLNHLIERAGNSNPQLERIGQEERVEQSRRMLLEAERIPNLHLQFGVDFNSPRDFKYGPRSQVSMKLPLFSRYQGEIAQSSATIVALEDQANATRRAVDGRVESAYFELDARETQARLYRESIVPAADQLENLAEASYQAGKANILYVLNAQTNVQQARLGYLQSLYTVQQAFAQLEVTVGEPLD